MTAIRRDRLIGHAEMFERTIANLESRNPARPLYAFETRDLLAGLREAAGILREKAATLTSPARSDVDAAPAPSTDFEPATGRLAAQDAEPAFVALAPFVGALVALRSDGALFEWTGPDVEGERLGDLRQIARAPAGAADERARLDRLRALVRKMASALDGIASYSTDDLVRASAHAALDARADLLDGDL